MGIKPKIELSYNEDHFISFSSLLITSLSLKGRVERSIHFHLYTVTCPKCDCDNVGYELCDTTAIESLINQVAELTKTNAKSIYKNKKLLSKLQNNSYTSGAVLNDLLLLVEELVELHNDTTTASSPLPKSCQEIKPATNIYKSFWCVFDCKHQKQNTICILSHGDTVWL